MFNPLLLAALIGAAPLTARFRLDGGRRPPAFNADLYGRITDSIYGKPLPGADIVVHRGGSVVRAHHHRSVRRVAGARPRAGEAITVEFRG